MCLRMLVCFCVFESLGMVCGCRQAPTNLPTTVNPPDTPIGGRRGAEGVLPEPLLPSQALPRPQDPLLRRGAAAVCGVRTALFFGSGAAMQTVPKPSAHPFYLITNHTNQDPFLFYVLCEYDEFGYHPVGYFSKEKYSDAGCVASGLLWV